MTDTFEKQLGCAIFYPNSKKIEINHARKGFQNWIAKDDMPLLYPDSWEDFSTDEDELRFIPLPDAIKAVKLNGEIVNIHVAPETQEEEDGPVGPEPVETEKVDGGTEVSEASPAEGEG